MRTTVEFEQDTAKAVEQLRRTQGGGVSAAVNQLIRQGLMAPREQPRFVQRTSSMGAMIDVSNVAEALEILEGPEAR